MNYATDVAAPSSLATVNARPLPGRNDNARDFEAALERLRDESPADDSVNDPAQDSAHDASGQAGIATPGMSSGVRMWLGSTTESMEEIATNATGGTASAAGFGLAGMTTRQAAVAGETVLATSLPAPLTAESLSSVLHRIETAHMSTGHAFEIVGDSTVRAVHVQGGAQHGWQLRLYGERGREMRADIDRLVDRLEALGHRIAHCEPVDVTPRP